MSVWAHLFPPFDAWWPNIYAGFWWSPFAALVLWLLHRAQRRWITRENDRHHRAVQKTLNDHHQRVARLMRGEDTPAQVLAGYAAEHDAGATVGPVQRARDDHGGHDSPDDGARPGDTG